MVDTPNIWADDKLHRESHAAFLQKFLTERTLRKAKVNGGSYVLNIDAEWGLGKSFFLDRFAQQLSLSGHAVVQINAWKDDYTDDPFVAVLAAIDRAISPYLDKQGKVASAWKTAKKVAAPIAIKTAAGIGKTLFKNYVGEELKTIIDDTIQDADISTVANQALEGGLAGIDKLADGFTEKIITEFKEQNQAISDFRANLENAVKLLEGKSKLPLFILIDELDRCRPSYAVSLLERVKHLFDASNICFVFATNNGQLQHTISGAYGPSFDGYRYLKRFFERTYLLPLPEPDDFARSLAKDLNFNVVHSPRNKHIDVLIMACAEYSFDLREIQQFFDLVDSAISAWQGKHKLEILILIPLVAQYIKEGKAEWIGAYKLIPDYFYVDIGFRDSTGSATRLDLKKVFQQLRTCATNMQNVSNLYQGQINDDPNLWYTLSSFEDEWNNNSTGGASEQYQIPRIISSAGHIN